MASSSPRTVLLAGASGFIGTHLARHLRRRGDVVRRLVRSTPAGEEELRWDPAAGELPGDALLDVDAVVNLGGAGIGDRRWTEEYKRTILGSRLEGTRTLATAIAGHVAAGHPAPRVLQASAVGFYGDRGEEVLTEDAAPGSGFLAEVCVQWESAMAPALTAGAKVAFLRTGIVLAPDGGALAPLLRLAKLGLAGPMGGGRHWWPWITIADHIRAQLHLLDSDLSGAVNLAAPGSARQREVAAALGRALGRPAVVPAPRFALRVVLGEFADDILASQRQVPAALESDGFAFRHHSVAEAATWVAERA